MAKMYYNLEEALAKLGCNDDQLKGLVRAGKLREFREAGKLNYKVDDVDRLTGEQGSLGDSSQMGGSSLSGSALSGSSSSGELSLEDSGEISLMPDDSSSMGELKLEDSTAAPAAKSDKSGSKSGTDAPVDLSGSSTGTGELKLEETGSGEIALSGSGTGELKLEDSRAAGSDAISLDEVDNDRLDGMKKDDTVITNIGISVFDDEDLEIAADPMAKTMLTSGADEHLGLDGSVGGSGLLDLTRESDDTSLGAELLEGIDMGDTAETIAPTQTADAIEPAAPQMEGGEGLPESSLEPMLPVGPRSASVHYVEAASPAFTGLLAAAAISLALLAITAVAMSMGVWPDFLNTLADNFWMGLGGMLGLGALAAGAGFLTTMKSSGPKAPKAPKQPKAKKEKKGKAKKGQPAPGLPEA